MRLSGPGQVILDIIVGRAAWQAQVVERAAPSEIEGVRRRRRTSFCSNSTRVDHRTRGTWSNCWWAPGRAALVAEVVEGELHPDGYNLGVNVSQAAGQTVGHVHIHLIPRYAGDVDDPRGGIRWIIPAKARYWELA